MNSTAAAIAEDTASAKPPASRRSGDSGEAADSAGIPDRRGIIDRRKLDAELIRLAFEGRKASEARPALLALLKGHLERGQAEVRRRFMAHELSGRAAAKALSFLADQLIRAIYDHIVQRMYVEGNLSKGERMALVAVGGYGRGELAPRSDIDILFLLPYKLTPRHEQVIETLLYLLWDLGLKVGHATRSVDECLRQARADMTIRTALLEKRFIWGDQSLYVELKERFGKEIQARTGKAFLVAKLDERSERHKRQGNSRYALEPNIKEGKGGLRDLHTLYWIAKYIYQVEDSASLVREGLLTRAEAKRFEKAEAFLWTLRFHMHYAAGRAEERLTFDLQAEIAPRMGYTDHAAAQAVERFMKHYFLVARDIGDLTRVLCATLEEQQRRPKFRLPKLVGRSRVEGFNLEGHRLTVKEPGVFEEKPIEMLRIFKVAQEHDLDIHPDALRWIQPNLKRIDAALRNDPAANAIFLDIMISRKDPETALRRMNEAGVFGRFVPDFGRVVGQMQFNRYHHYTVDEHTIFAVGVLHRIEQGKLREDVPIASTEVHKVLSRRLLYVAVLLHDVAKGRKGDHSEVGAKLAKKLCPRLGLTEEETETVAWLVLHHLVMSHTAFTRDIDDPQTVRDFADLVQSVERLRLLLVLTVADIRAVGPGTWTAWKAALLRDLYWRTEEMLTGGLAAQPRDRRIREAKRVLGERLESWPKKERSRHVASLPASYWAATDVESQLRHARMIREARRGDAPLAVDTRIDSYRGVTEVTVYTDDTPGLFSRIAGAIALAGGSIEGARIFTLTDGKALDSFYLESENGGAFDSPSQLARLSASIERTLFGGADIARALAEKRSSLPSRMRVFTVAPRVLVDNNASADHTVLEVNGRDRPALLHDVTAALTAQKLTIQSARISTFGERVVDVFYLQDARGNKITGEARLQRLREALMAALEGSEGQKPGEAEGAAKAPNRPKPAGPTRSARAASQAKAATTRAKSERKGRAEKTESGKARSAAPARGRALPKKPAKASTDEAQADGAPRKRGKAAAPKAGAKGPASKS